MATKRLTADQKRIKALETALAETTRALADAQLNEAERRQAEELAAYEAKNAQRRLELAKRDAAEREERDSKLKNIREGLIPLRELKGLIRSTQTLKDSQHGAIRTLIEIAGRDDDNTVQAAIINALTGKNQFSGGGYVNGGLVGGPYFDGKTPSLYAAPFTSLRASYIS